MKKIIRILLITSLIALTACGKNDTINEQGSTNTSDVSTGKTESSSQNESIQSEKEDTQKEETYVHFSESTATDNIAIALRFGKGYYAVKFNGEGFGDPLIKGVTDIGDDSSYSFSNDKICITKWFNVNAEAIIWVYNLWGLDKQIPIRIQNYRDSLLNGEDSYEKTETVENKDNIYLVKSTSTSSFGERYDVYVVFNEDAIHFGYYPMEYDTAKLIYDKIVDTVEFCYVPRDDKGDPIQAVTYRDSTEAFDASNWTFLNDLIGRCYLEKGIKIKNTSYIDSFNSKKYKLDDSGRIHLDPVFELSGELMTCGMYISIVSDETWDKVIGDEENLSSSMKKIDTGVFEKAFFHEGDDGGAMYVVTKDGGKFWIGTGMTYYNEPDQYRSQDTLNMFIERILILLEATFN